MRRRAAVVVMLGLVASACGGTHAGGSLSVSSAPPVRPHHQNATPLPGETLVPATGAHQARARDDRYAWERCNRSGQECAKVIGATLAFYTLSRADVGHTIRVVVSPHGSSSTESSASPPIGAGARGCFAAPGSCGFPDPATGRVGVANCDTLPIWKPSDLPSADYRVSGTTVDIIAANVTIRGYRINNWSFYVTGPNFTLDHDCVSDDGSNAGGSAVVWSTTSGMTVENSTLIAPGCVASATAVCNSKVDAALVSGDANTTVNNDVLAGAVEPVNGLGQGSVIANSYIVANGLVNGAHSEAIYESQTQNITIIHNTLLNPFDQTAVVFLDTLGHPCQNQATITDNLMGGGGYILYECSSGTGVGASRLIFTDNDIARCEGGSTFDQALGGHYCGSTPPSSTGHAIGYGQDQHGYWPRGGFFGLTDATNCPQQSRSVTWARNVWDDGTPVSCQ
ncbi:MAG: hypothetical protein ACTHMY_28775 [Solirubrobacteraceae bacterium]